MKYFMTMAAASLLFAATSASAQTPGNATQAGQGAALYARQCASCHGGQLEGGVGPALTGPAFHQMAASQQLTPQSLLERVSKTMPMTAPGSLKPADYAALVAFLLQQSGGLDASQSATTAPAATGRMASDGVYTAAQKTRGQALYSDNCLNCHGGDLNGVEDAPSLAGKTFLGKWGGLPLGALHAFIDKNMPPGNGGAVGAVSEADIVAYILSRNNFPAGATPLPSDPQNLAAIIIK